jgi:hypothetical protein
MSGVQRMTTTTQVIQIYAERGTAIHRERSIDAVILDAGVECSGRGAAKSDADSPARRKSPY